MSINKTNKKVSTLAATVAVATAFCGLCAGVATTVTAEAAPSNVQTSAATDNKVILNPGWNFENGVKKLNTITDAGVTEAAAATYHVDNAYICNLSVGETLPTPTAGRSGMTFLGWRYSKDGELVTVDKMPEATDGNVYLYANWKSSGSGGGGGGGEVDPPVTQGVTVNGKAMTKNTSPMEGVDEEYMLKGEQFSVGALTFSVNGSSVTISALDSASTGLSISGGTVSVTKAGKFDLYLKKKGTSWEVYGARDVSQDVTSITGEKASAGNIYLAGNITDANFSWNSWNAGGGYVGLKVTGSTITVRLTKGDDCKFVKFVNGSSDIWQKSLSNGGSNITFANQDANMKINATGTYKFTITESDGRLNVTVNSFTAG